MTEGWTAVIIKAEASRLFIPAAGRLSMFPACRKVNIIVALRTEGVRPVMNAKPHSAGIMISALNFFSRPRTKKRSQERAMLIMPTCSPDTAIICIAPDLEKLVSRSLSRSSLSPIVRAVIRPSASPSRPARRKTSIMPCAAMSDLSRTVRPVPGT